MAWFFRSVFGLAIYVLAAGWASLALWFDSPYPAIFAPLFLLIVATAFFYFERWSFRLLALAVLFGGALSWWLLLEPTNDRDWQPEVARLPSVETKGDLWTFRNVRNFEYRTETDFTPHWEDRTYDVSQLRGVDLYFSDWGAPGIAHTIASWDFGEGQYLAVSIETRKKVGDTYSAIRGFFRQYELYYVVADERDVIGVRAQHRGEKLHLYRMRVSRKVAHAILEAYVANINQLQAHPRWYNAFSANCTTSIRMNAAQAGAAKALNWRHFANKFLDELLYARNFLNTSLPFEELRARSDITAAAIAAAGSQDFSEAIRKGLPERMAQGDE